MTLPEMGCKMKAAVSEGVMIPKNVGGMVPKYSAEWWKRVANFFGEERTTDEHLPPPTAGTSLDFDEQGGSKNGSSHLPDDHPHHLPG